MEVWKDVVGYEGLYEVSNAGHVRSLHWYGGDNVVLLKSNKRKNGYLSLCLTKNGKHKTYLVHRIVAEAFIPNPDGLEMINHKDENKANNKVENLEWCTRSYNQKYSLALHPERKYVFGNNFRDKSTGELLSPMTKRIPRKHFRRIEQRTSDDVLIRTFENFVEASIETGLDSGNIKESCERNVPGRKLQRNRKTISKCGGYVWRYADTV